VFEGETPEELRKFFDFVSTLGTDGIMVSPGYSYEKAPDQEHFLQRERTQSLFRQVFTGKKWDLNHSKFFIDFFTGSTALSMHTVGQSKLQCVGLAKALLFDGRWLCRDV
jgi:hypothetical protein